MPTFSNALAGLAVAALVLSGGLAAAEPAAPRVRAMGQAAAAPRVHLIATGGTISNRRGGRLTADELLASIPDLASYATATAEQFANVASSQLTLEQWLALARRINQLFAAQPDLAGIVVTSGTDTLEETAYYLHLTVRTDRPVVVVGSMRNPSTLGYEGAANLLQAFRVAAEPRSRGKGVLVVLNDEINSAREATKTDALRLHTFKSPGYGILGIVDADRIVYYREPVQRHTARSEFDVSKVERLPRVDVIMVYQDAPGDLIRSAVDLGARGLVIAGAGAGATSGTQGEGIRYAVEKGVIVVVGTRTGSGRVAASRSRPAQPAGQSDADGTRRGGRVSAEDLTPIKARILLMLALTRTSDPAEIQRMFTEY